MSRFLRLQVDWSGWQPPRDLPPILGRNLIRLDLRFLVILSQLLDLSSLVVHLNINSIPCPRTIMRSLNIFPSANLRS